MLSQDDVPWDNEDNGDNEDNRGNEDNEAGDDGEPDEMVLQCGGGEM